MNRKQTLVEADKCVNGQREHDYGSPEDNFATIAEMWTSYLRRASSKFNPIVVTAHDVTVMMALLKIARIASGQVKDDNYVDGCGYLACAAEIATEKKNSESFVTLEIHPGLDEMDFDKVKEDILKLHKEGYPSGCMKPAERKAFLEKQLHIDGSQTGTPGEMLTYEHNPEDIIATVTSITEDEHALHVGLNVKEGKCLKEVFPKAGLKFKEDTFA